MSNLKDFEDLTKLLMLHEGVEYYEIYEDVEELYILDVKNWNELLEMEA